MSLKITILGCGTSAGVPMIGKGWGLCDSTNPKNRRRRCAIVIENEKKCVLIDAGPDIKDQLVDFGKTHFDALFITHEHADHIHGIDDLRWVCSEMNAPLKTYARKPVIDALGDRFRYALEALKPEASSYYKPVLEMIEIKDDIIIDDMKFNVIDQHHGVISSVGYRIGDFAYCTDVVRFNDAQFEKLKGVKVWVVDCLRCSKHNAHANLEQVLEWVELLKPEKTYLTHMDCSMDYATLMRELPDGVEPAYDGMEIIVNNP